MTEGQDAGGPAGHANAMGAGRRLRLLVIDDDTVHRMIIARVAAKIGFATSHASSFDEAKNVLVKESFDCITLDLSLGRHAGVEVLRLLAAARATCPIIVISGSDAETFETTVAVGKSLHLCLSEGIHKPVDLALLRNTLMQVVLDDLRATSKPQTGVAAAASTYSI